MIKEFCAENFTNIPKALSFGASRVELCDNLAVGGTTPSAGVMEESIDYAHSHQAEVMTMIRPRGGSFVYHGAEVRIMQRDIELAKKLGSDGVVFGCLNESGWLDEATLIKLIALSQGMKITFHMAFDQLSIDNQWKAIDWLAENGVSRILTHGGTEGTLIGDNISHLEKLISYAGDRLIILPGGGINIDNMNEIVDRLGVNEVHGTRIVRL